MREFKVQTANKANKVVCTMGKKQQSFSKDFKAKVALEAFREESTIQELVVKHEFDPAINSV